MTEDPITPHVIKPVTGYHWLIDLSGCKAGAEVLGNRELLEYLIPLDVEKAGMHVVGKAFHQFLPTGVTGAVILSESHVTVHTWPEERFVAIDVYVCNFNDENFLKGERLARSLERLFQASTSNIKMVERLSRDAQASNRNTS